MKRYKRTCSGDCQSYDYSFQGVKMFSEVVVDKTRFKPSLVRNDFGQRVDGLGGVPQYHFKDGIDNGYKLSAIDTINPDVTEIDNSMQMFQNAVDEQYHNVNEQLQKEVENLKNVVEKTSQNHSTVNSQSSVSE